MRNLHQLFVLRTASQIIGGDFVKFCGLLRIYELFKPRSRIEAAVGAILMNSKAQVIIKSYNKIDPKSKSYFKETLASAS